MPARDDDAEGGQGGAEQVPPRLHGSDRDKGAVSRGGAGLAPRAAAVGDLGAPRPLPRRGAGQLVSSAWEGGRPRLAQPPLHPLPVTSGARGRGAAVACPPARPHVRVSPGRWRCHGNGRWEPGGPGRAGPRPAPSRRPPLCTTLYPQTCSALRAGGEGCWSCSGHRCASATQVLPEPGEAPVPSLPGLLQDDAEPWAPPTR